MVQELGIEAQRTLRRMLRRRKPASWGEINEAGLAVKRLIEADRVLYFRRTPAPDTTDEAAPDTDWEWIYVIDDKLRILRGETEGGT